MPSAQDDAGSLALDTAEGVSAAFWRAMQAVGPFEPGPALAVAVSGGGDSLALTLLAQDWAAAHGGTVVALTVDHGLRPGSDADARRVRDWMAGRGIPCHLLRWQAAKPQSNIQAAARAARYRLLGDWCRTNGVLHLLVAHTIEDQAETVLLRLGRGSGLDGLAGMPAVREDRGCRIIRPLLGVDRTSLRILLTVRGQDWIEDPANTDCRHTRSRVRAAMPALGDFGATTERLAATSASLGRARNAADEATAALLASAVRLHPAGHAVLDPRVLAAAPRDPGLRALARLLCTVSGAIYMPRLARLEALFDTLGERGRTLHGCRIRPRDGRVLVHRETAAVEGAVAIEPCETREWDRRFLVRLGPEGPWQQSLHLPLHVARLGSEGWRAVRAAGPASVTGSVPAVVAPLLPALWDLDGPVAVPHLSSWRRVAPPSSDVPFTAEFRPPRPLAGPGFSEVVR